MTLRTTGPILGQTNLRATKFSDQWPLGLLTIRTHGPIFGPTTCPYSVNLWETDIKFRFVVYSYRKRCQWSYKVFKVAVYTIPNGHPFTWWLSLHVAGLIQQYLTGLFAPHDQIDLPDCNQFPQSFWLFTACVGVVGGGWGWWVCRCRHAWCIVVRVHVTLDSWRSGWRMNGWGTKPFHLGVSGLSNLSWEN